MVLNNDKYTEHNEKSEHDEIDGGIDADAVRHILCIVHAYEWPERMRSFCLALQPRKKRKQYETLGNVLIDPRNWLPDDAAKKRILTGPRLHEKWNVGYTDVVAEIRNETHTHSALRPTNASFEPVWSIFSCIRSAAVCLFCVDARKLSGRIWSDRWYENRTILSSSSSSAASMFKPQSGGCFKAMMTIF